MSENGVGQARGSEGEELRRDGKVKEVAKPADRKELPIHSGLGFLASLIPSLLVSIFIACGFVYFGRIKLSKARPAPVLGISTSTLIDGDILAVWDYVSTPDFRTEWHMRSVEVSGPAIDHSAVVGEQFVEDFSIDDSNVDAEIEWSVVEREVPVAGSSSRALFVLEGVAVFGGGSEKARKQVWREAVKMQSAHNKFSKGPQVHVEMELILDGGIGGEANGDSDGAKKWRRRLKRSMKESLMLLRSRMLDEDAMQRASSV